MVFRLITSILALMAIIMAPRLAVSQDEVWREHANAGRQAHEDGDFAEAERLLRLALSEVERLGRDDVRTADVLDDLARLLNDLPKFTEAESLAKRALKINESANGPNSREVSCNLDTLGAIYCKQGRYADSESNYRRALAIVQELPDAQVDDLAGAELENLGNLLIAMSQYEEAARLHRRVLERWEGAYGPDDEHVARTLNNLAVIYYKSDRLSDAEASYRRSFAILEKSLGAKHPLVATSLHNLAFVLKDMGRYDEAERVLKRSLGIREGFAGNHEFEIAQNLDNLSGLRFRQGRYGEAESLARRALAIFEKTVGPDHDAVGRSLMDIARISNSLERYAEAEAVAQRALPIVRKAGGDFSAAIVTLADSYKGRRKLHGSGIALEGSS